MPRLADPAVPTDVHHPADPGEALQANVVPGSVPAALSDESLAGLQAAWDVYQQALNAYRAAQVNGMLAAGRTPPANFWKHHQVQAGQPHAADVQAAHLRLVQLGATSTRRTERAA